MCDCGILYMSVFFYMCDREYCIFYNSGATTKLPPTDILPRDVYKRGFSRYAMCVCVSVTFVKTNELIFKKIFHHRVTKPF